MQCKKFQSPIKQGVFDAAPYLSHIPATFWQKEISIVGDENNLGATEFRGSAIDIGHYARLPPCKTKICTTKNLEQTARRGMPDSAEAVSDCTARHATGTDHGHASGSTRSDIAVISDGHRRHRRH
jgi:hypothetical protein